MWTKFLRLFFPCLVEEPKRARYMDGRLKGDDKKTPTINEAWEGGKAPAKKRVSPVRDSVVFEARVWVAGRSY